MTASSKRLPSLSDRLLDAWVAPAYLVLCLATGGGTGSAIPNAILQLAGISLLAWLFGRGSLTDLPREAAAVKAILLATIAFLLLSLVPLPPAVWTLLPGREPIAASYALLDVQLPWLPVSLAPTATMAALLGVIPPAAMLLSVLVTSPRGRFFAVVTLGGMGVASALLGMQQQLTGYDSPWYLYQQTSRGGAVGFFANRNHFATFCLMTLPLLAALAAASDRISGRERRLGQRIIALAALTLVVVGIMVAQSVAGWLLLLPALLGCIFVYRRSRTKPTRLVASIGAGLLVVGVGLALYAPVATDWWSENASEMRPRERRESMRLTFAASLEHLPVGSGAGSFVRTYPAYESPAAATPTFVNHTHNDYLELILETGIVGVLLLGAFVWWWGRRAVALWTGSGSGTVFGRAGAVSLALLFAHSFVDFPFRTSAIASVAALATGLMIAPSATASSRRRRPEESGEPEREISLASGPARPRGALVRTR